MTEVLGRRVVASHRLGGGCLFDVRAVDLEDGRRVVVKGGAGGVVGQPRLEARMLGDLAAAGAAVPAVLDVGDDRLVLEWIASDGGGLSRAGRRAFAAQLAALHELPQPDFGYEYDTVIGTLPQPNPRGSSWRVFFAEHRVFAPAERAAAEGVLDGGTLRRLRALADRLEAWIEEPSRASLLHGDLWSGNVLARDGHPVAWIDPAIYRGDAEIELAFGLLFGPLDADSLAAYAERRPLAPGFQPTRCAIYQIYPLLVHLRLFGQGYLAPIRQRLEILGL